MTGVKRHLTKIALAAGLLSLAACDTLGNPFVVLGRKAPSPDEFQVVSRKPLAMPGTVTLPEPRLGERSPLDPDPSRDAVAALLGNPGPVTGASGSAGEAALLAAANAQAGDTDIRAKVEADRTNEAENKPYEAPLLFDLIGGGSAEDTSEALDPDAEARRLQTSGVAPAPNNPANLPRTEQAKSDSDDLFYETDTGVPNNRLPTQNSKPAFE